MAPAMSTTGNSPPTFCGATRTAARCLATSRSTSRAPQAPDRRQRGPAIPVPGRATGRSRARCRDRSCPPRRPVRRHRQAVLGNGHVRPWSNAAGSGGWPPARARRSLNAQPASRLGRPVGNGGQCSGPGAGRPGRHGLAGGAGSRGCAGRADLGAADLIVGTSAGAIVGAILASGEDPARLAAPPPLPDLGGVRSG